MTRTIRVGLFFVAIASLLSCATRTKYEPHGNSGGYSETTLDSGVNVARFSGNAHTTPGDAKIFSQFRAVELCEQQGSKVTRILKVEDKSQSKDVQKSETSTHQRPSTIDGSSNSIGGYTSYSGTVTGGSATSNTTSWIETLNFPIYDAYFSCANQVYLTGIVPKDLSADEMKSLVKDLLGAIQVQSFGEQSPNKGVLRVGDIIYKLNKERVTTVDQFSAEVNSSKEKLNLKASIFRDGQPLVVKIKATDSTDTFLKFSEQLKAAACTVSEVKTRPICQNRMPASRH